MASFAMFSRSSLGAAECSAAMVRRKWPVCSAKPSGE